MLQNKVVYLVGVCGAGMAPLAIYLSERGATVYGWDDFPDPAVKDLLIGKHIVFLPKKILPDHCEVVVISSAIRVDEDEICQAANSKTIPIWRRGEYLAHIIDDKKLIAIVGSHGKTSVCANMAELAIKNEMHIDYVVGGFFKNDKYPPAKYFPDAEWIIAEIDESDCTMESFSAQITIALNYDDDHIGNYNGADGLKAAFSRFFSRTKGKIFLTAEDEVFPLLVEGIKAQVQILHGLSNRNFALRNQEIAQYVFGEIFGSNIKTDADFDGVKRRNDLLCKTGNITFVHDYAHHPTEVKALLDYVRSAYCDYKVTVVFQPHRVSRTKQYYKEFAQILQQFDSVILVDIYRAFEERLSEVSSNLIFDRIDNSAKVLVNKLDKLGTVLANFCQNLDPKEKNLILFVCAGDLVKYAKKFVNEWNIEIIRNELSEIKYFENISLRNKTTFGCNAIARLLVCPKDFEQLGQVVSICRRYNKAYFVIGRGSNVVFPDGVFNDVVIQLDAAFWQNKEMLNDDTARIFSGVKLSELAEYMDKIGFNCCSFLSCIPGTVGGAIRMNAGAHGFTISELVDSVTVMDSEGKIVRLTRDECGFKYRGSAVQGIILYTDVKLRQIESLTSQRFIELRNDTQPRGRTFGSIFKNPEGDYAGRLIDSAGLKGLAYEDAVISEKHANFMINLGNATARDVEMLVDLVRYEVFRRFGVFLENEFLLLRRS